MPSFFPATYLDARHEFMRIAGKHKLAVHSTHLKEKTGPAGEALFIDIASRLTGSKAALVTTSGLHGVEGFAGSPLQACWMDAVDPLANGSIDIIHVHALNPYGFAWSRRADHDNIDVNRNFLPAFPPPDPNEAYRPIADHIVPKKPGWIAKARADLGVAWLIKRYGMEHMKDIVSAGQYVDPKGLFYGGDRPSWSRRQWQLIMDSKLSSYERVLHIDIHTGLGKRGGLSIIASEEDESVVASLRKIWGEQLAVLTQKNNTSESSLISGDITGSWSLNRHAPLPGVTVAFEFGTAPPLEILKALRAEHAAFAQGLEDGKRADAGKAMRDAFAPQDVSWVSDVLQNGTRAYASALSALRRQKPSSLHA